jgi:hypothetical protein
VLLIECSRNLLLAGLKFCLGIFEGEPRPLCLGKNDDLLSLTIACMGTWPGAYRAETPILLLMPLLPLVLLQQSVHPVKLWDSRHELQQLIEAILNDDLV